MLGFHRISSQALASRMSTQDAKSINLMQIEGHSQLKSISNIHLFLDSANTKVIKNN